MSGFFLIKWKSKLTNVNFSKLEYFTYFFISTQSLTRKKNGTCIAPQKTLFWLRLLSITKEYYSLVIGCYQLKCY